MDGFILFGLFLTIFFLFVQFARQEHFEESYQGAVIDVESRLEWANSRSTFPFGMKAQLEVSSNFLVKAKNLWQENKWQQAYRAAIQAQQAMGRAQQIYCSVIRNRQR